MLLIIVSEISLANAACEPFLCDAAFSFFSLTSIVTDGKTMMAYTIEIMP